MTFGKVLISGLLLAGAQATSWRELHDYSFGKFVQEFAPQYESDVERAMRKTLFEARLADVIAHNSDASQTYRRGVNQFSDRTGEELAQYKGLDRHLSRVEHARRARAVLGTSRKKTDLPTNVTDLPVSLDWRDQGVITPIKNQGSCGSCWTFASTETLESHWAIKTGNLEELSEQFILDCAPNTHHCGGDGGCAGGTAELAYAKLHELGGMPSEWTYPYVSGTGNPGKCHGLPLPPARAHSGGVMAAANVTGYMATAENSYNEMMTALATIGPLAVSVDAGAWSDYEEGVFTGGNLTNPELDHLVQLIGYGEDDGMKYWLVRNSWTPLWGESGFIRLARYGDGKEPCGMDINPAVGNGCDDGPATVRVCGQSGVLYDGVYPLVD